MSKSLVPLVELFDPAAPALGRRVRDPFLRLVLTTLRVPGAVRCRVDDGALVVQYALGDGGPLPPSGLVLEGISLSRLLQLGEPIAVEDLQDSRRLRSWPTGSPWVSLLAVPIFDVKGGVANALCALDDHPRAWTEEERSILTELAACASTNLQLRQSLSHPAPAPTAKPDYRLLVENAVDIIYSIDLQGYFTYANVAAGRVTGYPLDEVTGMHFTHLVRPDYRTTMVDWYAVQIERGTPQTTFEFPAITKSGEEIWLSQIVQLVHEGDAVIGFQAIARDVPGLHHMGVQLRERNSDFGSLLKNALDLITVLSDDLHVRYMSPAVQRLCGYPAGDLVGSHLSDLVHPEDLADATEILLEAVQASAVPRECVFRVRHSDGSWRYLESIVTARLDNHAGGGIVLNSRAVTERWALTERLQILDTAVRTMQLGVTVTRMDGTIEYANHAEAEMHGYEVAELLGQNASILGAPELRRPRPGASVRFTWVRESSNIRKDSSAFPVELWSDVVIGSGEEPIALITCSRDITHQKAQEEALRRSEERFRTAFQEVPTAIIVTDLEGRVTLWNPAAERLFGWREDEVLGLPDPTPLRGQWKALEAVHERLSHGEVVLQMITRCRTRNGSRMDAHRSYAPLHDADGHVCGMMAAVMDMTEPKRLERERERLLDRERSARERAQTAERRAKFLADAATLLEASFTAAGEATFQVLARATVPTLADYCVVDAVNAEGAVTRAAAVHVHAGGEALLLELPTPDFDLLATGGPLMVPDFAGLEGGSSHLETASAHWSILATRSLLVVPLIARGRTLGAITLGTTAASKRTYGPDDLALVEELARRAALTLDNERLLQEAERSTKSRDDILAIVSHDLRSPLNVMQMSVHAVLRGWPPQGDAAAERRQLEIAGRSAKRMRSLIRELMDVARIDSGHLVLDRLLYTPGRIIQEVGDLHRPLTQAKPVILEIDPADALPLISADYHRLLQVFANLIDNALRFTPANGRITVSARRADECICFSVADTGSGIPQDHLPHIFDRYWGGCGTSGESGLGLAIAKGFVDAHGGRIWVESEVGVGTTFHFTIPSAGLLPP